LSCQVRIEAINKHRADISKCVSARLIGPDNIVFMPKAKI
jgi:hypothetical protein